MYDAADENSCAGVLVLSSHNLAFLGTVEKIEVKKKFALRDITHLALAETKITVRVDTSRRTFMTSMASPQIFFGTPSRIYMRGKPWTGHCWQPLVRISFDEKLSELSKRNDGQGHRPRQP